LLELSKALQTTYSNHIINSSERHSTILVTGCSGFIGSHLVDRLLKEAENYRYEIRCMTRDVDSIEGFFSEGSRQNVETSINITQYLYKESFVLLQLPQLPQMTNSISI